MNIRSIVFMVCMLFIQCSNEKNESNGLEQMKIKNGYKFYKELDLLNLSGKEDLINLKKIEKYPIYGIQNSGNNKIIIATINKGITFWQVFYKFQGAFISTKYYKDEELNSYFTREISIVKDGKFLCFEYICEEDFEYLSKVFIEFKKGEKVSYQNSEKTNLNFAMDIDTNNIEVIYPTLKKIEE